MQVLLAFMLNLHLRGRHLSLGLADLGRALWESPTAFLLILIVIGTVMAMVRLAHDASGTARFLLGFFHSLTLFCTLAPVMLAASRLSSAFGTGIVSLLAFLGLVAVLGGAHDAHQREVQALDRGELALAGARVSLLGARGL